MDRKSVAALVALGFVVGGWSSGAKAATIAPLVLTFSGTVAPGIDPFGYFGGGDLTGKPFTDTITIPYNEQGLIVPYAKSQAVLTIGDYTYSYNAYGYSGISNNTLTALVSTIYTHGLGLNTLFQVQSAIFASYAGQQNDLYLSQLGFLSGEGYSLSGRFFLQNGYPSLFPPDAEIDFDVTSVSAVPIPSSLPLFAVAILAFGCVGWVRRRMRIRLGSIVTKRRSLEPIPV